MEKALKALDTDTLRLYPDPTAGDLVHSIAAFYGLKDEQVFTGVGSDDVLAMCFLTVFNSEKPILFPDITYSFYDVWADLFRIPYERPALDEEFHIRKEDYFRENGGIVFPNPNAPTGVEMPLSEIEEIVAKNPESIVIVDEAYVDFGATSALPLIEKYDNLLVVQTFSKSRSLAGMRIGYAFGNPELIKYLNDVKYSFNSYTMDRTTIAAGVAKAKADLIVISGAEGGTGASPASSMRYAGISPEIGLSETQQTLVLNGLRGQVRLQTDGQLKTGRNIISMALLGAEEFGFGTSVLIVLGCVMMRKCHANTCPVGVATQDPQLRAHFRGHYRYVVNFFRFLAQEVREYLAEMGFSRLEDIVGRTDLIEIRPTTHEKASLLDFSKLLHKVDNGAALHNVTEQRHEIEHVKDVSMLAAAREALENRKEVSLEYAISNTDRSVGAMLSGAVAAKYGQTGLPSQTIQVKFKGSAGQSFGAFLPHGVSFKLEGEANDYLGKGLSGGHISVQPPVRSNFLAENNVIAGNTLLYGATSGEVYINGCVGERFAVRNSGAITVVEGVGDHCCEYMTGGRVVVLGKTGRNFAAGMSGGVAYVWDKDRNFDYFCNMEMVELSLLEDATARKELHELARHHYLYTGSQLARTMLDNWSRYVEEFIQVTPIEYKKVLAEEQMRKLQQKIAEVQRDY